MRRTILALFLVCAIAALMVTSFARVGSKDNSFLGIWEGIDRDDGSNMVALISSNHDGTYHLLWRESYWSSCEGRRGVLEGTGEIEPNGNLVFDVVLSCFDPDEDVLFDTMTFEQIDRHQLSATLTITTEFEDRRFFRTSHPWAGAARSGLTAIED